MPKSVAIYSQGLVCCSVCTDLTDTKEIEAEVNRQNPTGSDTLRWSISKDKTFNGGLPNPCPCEQVEGRRHFLLNC